MKVIILKSTWGMSGSIDEIIRKISGAGYDGVETGIPQSKDSRFTRKLIDKNNLKLILSIYTTGDNHLKSFIDQYKKAVQWNPVLVVLHSARDCMDFDEQRKFFEIALNWESKLGVSVAHETHRHRAFYTPWTTTAILKEFPELKICADFSHWCCVCESLLDDQGEHIKLASQRAIHIHGRIGFEEGPQVPDPRAPEYSTSLERHEQWWETIYTIRKKRKDKIFTFTPEFGPPYYQWTLPYTQQPVANIWDINLWMGNRFRKKYC